MPGESVKMHDGLTGIVVINFETGATSRGYTLGGWSDIEGGLLVITEDLGLVRYSREILDLKFPQEDSRSTE